MIDQYVSAVVTALLLWAVVCDVGYRLIPDRISIMMLFVGVAVDVVDSHLIGSLVAGFVIFLLVYALWRVRALGGGDVKLMTATSFVLLPVSVPSFVLAVMVAGGGLATLYLVLRRAVQYVPGSSPDGMIKKYWRIERWRIARGCPLPYAAAIAAGYFSISL